MSEQLGAFENTRYMAFYALLNTLNLVMWLRYLWRSR